MPKFKLDKRLIIIIAVYVIALIELVAILPLQLKKALHLRSEITTAKRKIEQFKLDKNSQEKFVDDQERVNADIFNLKSKILEEGDVSAISAYISKNAKKNAVEILELSPAQTQEYRGTSEGQFLHLPLSIEAKAGYHSLGQFLNALEEGDYFLETKEVVIKEKSPYHRIHIVVYAVVKKAQLQ